MSEIEELVINAIQEFGDRAYKRFSVAGIGFVDCKSNDDLTNHDFYIVPKSLPELFVHGCDVYGFEQEVVMWEFYCPTEKVWGDFKGLNYDECIELLGWRKCRRKLSAAREFCLNDAKSGEAVEILQDGKWSDCRIVFCSSHRISNDSLHYRSLNGARDDIELANLRMKYPKKAQS